MNTYTKRLLRLRHQCSLHHTEAFYFPVYSFTAPQIYLAPTHSIHNYPCHLSVRARS